MLPPSKLWTKYRRWRQRNPFYRQPLAWLVSVIAAIGGGVLYLVRPSDWTWWLGGALTIPLIVLVMERGRRFTSSSPSDGVDGGPWGPP